MKKHPEQNEQFEAQLRNLPDTVNQSLAGLTAGTELNNRIQMRCAIPVHPVKRRLSRCAALCRSRACAPRR